MAIHSNNQIVSKEYGNSLERHGMKDGMHAIIFYLIYIAFSFFQGYLYTTAISVALLTASQIMFPILQIILCISLIWYLKNGINSIGITLEHVGLSLILGVLGAVLLLMFQFVFNPIRSNTTVSLQMATSITVLIFAVGAVSEELIFRGYIQTRLWGLIRKPMITSCITAILFVFIHYPVKWIVSGTMSMGLLSGVHIICLLLLHFLCDLVYKKTNCIWGSVVLHFLYNTLGSMIIYT